MLKRKKFIIGGIIVIIAIALLTYEGIKAWGTPYFETVSEFMGSATYYSTVNEITEQGSSIYDENVRVNGLVAPGSLEQKSAGGILTFTITDIEGDESLPIVYQGVVPDTFKVGNEVVVEGHLNSNGNFQAHTLMTKCPSKYEPE